MNIENLSTLKIHRLTQAQYDRELQAGRIDENALYLTPDESSTVKTVNGIAPDSSGNIEIDVGGVSGGTSSWNDLTDKPFYEENIVLDIQWDGEIENRTYVQTDEDVYLVHVSDYVLEKELVGMTMSTTRIVDGVQTEDSITLEESYIISYGNGILIADMFAFVAPCDNFNLLGIIFPKKGIYFLKNNDFYTSSIIGECTLVKKLDNKYIDSNDSVTINLSYSYEEGNEEPVDVVVDSTFSDILNAYNNGQGVYICTPMYDGAYMHRQPAIVTAIGEEGIIGAIYLAFTDPIENINLSLVYSLDGYATVIQNPFLQPDSEPSNSSLPEVTVDNNGDVLTVVDGSWAVGKIEIPEDNYPVTSVNGMTGDVTVEIPTILPNPNALTFTGVASGTYDGSEAVSIEIPSGIPEATAENEGAFLRIVNGVPTWVILEVAEEGAY